MFNFPPTMDSIFENSFPYIRNTLLACEHVSITSPIPKFMTKNSRPKGIRLNQDLPSKFSNKCCIGMSHTPDSKSAAILRLLDYVPINNMNLGLVFIPSLISLLLYLSN